MLEKVGGWDPYNVTEDADLGLRLRRFGYRTGVISRPTLEDAPENLQTWLPQRTRWFKGWLLTWLVHMRSPMQLYRDLGPASFLATQVLFLGMFASALFHPFFVATVLFAPAKLIWSGSIDSDAAAVALLDIASIAAGYAAFIILGVQVSSHVEKRRLWVIVAFTPIYWLMLSLAAWLAMWEAYRRPHHWAKTPHFRTRFTGEQRQDGVSSALQTGRR